MRRGIIASVVATALVLGFALGTNYGALRRGFADLAQSLGLVGGAHDADAAYAAYQNGNYAPALRIAQPLADEGDVRAATLLGLMSYHGRGTARSDVDAMRWFRLAAEKGDAEAQYHLGIMLGEGQSVPQDHVAAAKWYQRAAEQGHAQAQYNLGLAYARGEGVTQDNMRAHMWFNVAAARFAASDARGRGAAVRNRDVIAGKMSREELADAQRLARDWQPK
jgi:TPR repeat protein